ncbi:MAG: phosphatase PAP2 family protein [Rickettsiales bacterium]|jgi:membrane-associated phospholipid phosphatase|nr:phosphatase PAP2 family protein [Rickettsiales bacterium]
MLIKMLKPAATLLTIFLLLATDTEAKLDVEEIGNYFQVMVPTYALGMAMNETGYGAAKQLVYSYLSMQATVQILKVVVNEKRPDYSEGNTKDSFPSGHTAAAFSGATFIHRRYGIEKAVIPYIMATFTGYSRLHANKHYFHNVVAGALISSLYTWIFVDKKDNLILSTDGNDLRISYRINF